LAAALTGGRAIEEFKIVSIRLLSLAPLALALIDLRQGIIPNWHNLANALVGLARSTALDGLAAALLAGCEGLIVDAIAWLLRWVWSETILWIAGG
jgi:leader peptidase (prepilin peptidase)/N-methyltransferase